MRDARRSNPRCAKPHDLVKRGGFKVHRLTLSFRVPIIPHQPGAATSRQKPPRTALVRRGGDGWPLDRLGWSEVISSQIPRPGRLALARRSSRLAVSHSAPIGLGTSRVAGHGCTRLRVGGNRQGQGPRVLPVGIAELYKHVTIQENIGIRTVGPYALKPVDAAPG